MSNLIDLIPKMISNTSSIGTALASSVYINNDNGYDFNPFRLFDKDSNSADGHRFTTNAVCPQWVQFKFNNPMCVNAYSLRAESTIWLYNIGSCLPKTWNFMASNTGSFTGEEIILDTITNFMVQKNDNTEHIFYFNNSTEYIYYRLLWTDLDRTDSFKRWTIVNEGGLYYVSYNKYLIMQNNEYYSIKDNTLTELGVPTDDTQKEEWFNNYGVNDLKLALLTPDENGNKLINSLDNQFQVRMMKSR